MKLKTNIARLLATGLLLNNIYFYSNANTLDDEIPGRYETLEGEYITIDDSMEGNLEEIEIFGDTWQDSDSPNIFDGKLEKGYYDITNGVKFDSDVIKRSSNFTPYEGTFVSNKNLTVLFYDSNYNYLEYTQVSPYKTDNTNAKYFKIHYNINVCPGDDVMINLGTKLLDYVPYHKADLSNIQSVGDLHVDKNGNPILDSQGREQYKIDVIGAKSIYEESYNSSGKKIGENKYSVTGNSFFSFVAFNIDPKDVSIGDKIVVELEILKIPSNGDLRLYMSTLNFTDSQINAAKKLGKQKFEYTVTKIPESISRGALIELTPNTTNETIEFKFKMYKESQQSKTTILLPCQLQKVGDVADRLYWDNKKNKYVIEKKIGMLNLSNENHQYKFIHLSGGQNIRIEFDGYNQILQNNGNCILTYPLVFTWDSLGNYENYSLRYDYPTIVLSLDRLGNFEESTIRNYLINNPLYIYNELKSYEYIETNITSKLKVPTYEGKTYIFAETENGINPTLKVTVDRLPQIAKNAVEEAENDSTSYNISLARMYVNMLPESLYKDQLQEQLSEVFSSDITLDRESASSNLDVYVKSENMLSMSLDTNSITFDGYSGVDAMEMLSAVNISINSSLPYDLNAYIPAEITNADGSSTIDFDILNIKESSESTYQQFADTTNKVVLKSDCAKGNGNIHNIDLKLDSNAAHKADIYKTVIKFEAEQK